MTSRRVTLRPSMYWTKQPLDLLTHWGWTSHLTMETPHSPAFIAWGYMVMNLIVLQWRQCSLDASGPDLVTVYPFEILCLAFLSIFFFVASKYLDIDKYVLRLTTPSCSIGLHYLCASIVQFYVSACICAVKLFSFLWTVDQKGENSETKLRDLPIVNGCGFSLNILDNPVC